MSIRREEIRAWLQEGKEKGATHTIIVCDTFDHGDYPVHVMAYQSVGDIAEAHNGPNMTRLMEVYSHALDHEAQLDERRSMHFEITPFLDGCARPPSMRPGELTVEDPMGDGISDSDEHYEDMRKREQAAEIYRNKVIAAAEKLNNAKRDLAEAARRLQPARDAVAAAEAELDRLAPPKY